MILDDADPYLGYKKSLWEVKFKQIYNTQILF